MTVRITEVTNRQRKHAKRVKALIRAQFSRVSRTDRSVAARVERALANLKQRIARISDHRFSAIVLPELEDQLSRSMNGLVADVSEEIRLLIDESARNGVTKVLGPLRAAGISGLPTVAISQNLVNTTSRFVADLITRIAEEKRVEISEILTDHLLGGKTRAEALKAIGSSLPGAGPFGTISARARVILRTESLRIHSIVAEQQLAESARFIPGLHKQWFHTGIGVQSPRSNHVAFDGTVVPWDEPFELPAKSGGTVTLRFPRDPLGPPEEVVNCACMVEEVFPEDFDPDAAGEVKGKTGTLKPDAASAAADAIADRERTLKKSDSRSPERSARRRGETPDIDRSRSRQTGE